MISWHFKKEISNLSGLVLFGLTKDFLNSFFHLLHVNKGCTFLLFSRKKVRTGNDVTLIFCVELSRLRAHLFIFENSLSIKYSGNFYCGLIDGLNLVFWAETMFMGSSETVLAVRWSGSFDASHGICSFQ